jgi:integrase
MDIKQLTRWHIDHYIDRLLLRAKNRTANAHLTVLKSFCRWLSKSCNVPNVAVDIPMLREDPPKQRVLTHEEYLKVLTVCTDGEADIIRFLRIYPVKS